MNVRLFRPTVGEEELNAIRRVFERSWIGLGPTLDEFERRWTEYIGCRESIGVNSGTAALHLALAVLRFPQGSKVLVPALTFVSTAAAVLYNNLVPVFVDCDEEMLGLDFDDLQRKYTKECVAVMPVHMGGHPVPMDRLVNFARERNLKIIEDCAHCGGGRYLGRSLGTWGDVGCFSFEEKKCMTTGDGGMICCNDEELARPLRAMRWLGIDKDTWKRNANTTRADNGARHWYYEIALLGYKYNMNDLSASIGIEQLKKLPAFNAARLAAMRRYMEGTRHFKHIRPLLPYDLSGECHYHLFGVRCERRDELILHLKERGVATGVHYTPLHLQPLFREYATPMPHAEHLYERMLTLPLFAAITTREIDHVLGALEDFDSSP